MARRAAAATVASDFLYAVGNVKRGMRNANDDAIQFGANRIASLAFAMATER
jgi:hypothetical protein